MGLEICLFIPHPLGGPQWWEPLAQVSGQPCRREHSLAELCARGRVGHRVTVGKETGVHRARGLQCGTWVSLEPTIAGSFASHQSAPWCSQIIPNPSSASGPQSGWACKTARPGASDGGSASLAPPLEAAPHLPRPACLPAGFETLHCSAQRGLALDGKTAALGQDRGLGLRGKLEMKPLLRI